MALLDPTEAVTYGCTLTLRMAGAESNVAIALSRLGIESSGSPASAPTSSAM